MAGGGSQVKVAAVGLLAIPVRFVGGEVGTVGKIKNFTLIYVVIDVTLPYFNNICAKYRYAHFI